MAYAFNADKSKATVKYSLIKECASDITIEAKAIETIVFNFSHSIIGVSTLRHTTQWSYDDKIVVLGYEVDSTDDGKLNVFVKNVSDTDATIGPNSAENIRAGIVYLA